MITRKAEGTLVLDVVPPPSGKVLARPSASHSGVTL